MPKDEFDVDDPLELNGVAFLTDEDTSAEMAGCFTEEFLRMGYNPKQVLALFLNPHYIGPNLVLANKGEPFVRDIIAETFARWGRPEPWPASPELEPLVRANPSELADDKALKQGAAPAGAVAEADALLTDPLGHPAPTLNL